MLCLCLQMTCEHFYLENTKQKKKKTLLKLISDYSKVVKCGPLEKGMANHFSILALRTP